MAAFAEATEALASGLLAEVKQIAATGGEMVSDLSGGGGASGTAGALGAANEFGLGDKF
jgi:hypothetical protein